MAAISLNVQSLWSVPELIPDADKKLYQARAFVPIMAFISHFFWMVGYLSLSIYPMVSLNALSAAIYFLVWFLVRKGFHLQAMLIAAIETTVHLPIASWLIGIDTGGLMFFLVAVMAAPVVLPRENFLRKVLVVGFILSAALSFIFLSDHMPIIPLEKWQRNGVFLLISLTAFVSVLSYSNYFVKLNEAYQKLASDELKRSEKLLLNILPSEIALKLKDAQDTISEKFESVTVLFADIVGFTAFCAEHTSEEVVETLNIIFSEFDQIAAKHGLEKIKTIGDAYMAVAGLPIRTADHATKTVAMAIEMLNFITSSAECNRRNLKIRVGMHSGSVVAGVIGKSKFSYDLWGDTVNIASRMESHGEINRIQISKTTADLVSHKFKLESRGEISIKGKGMLETWLLAHS